MHLTLSLISHVHTCTHKYTNTYIQCELKHQRTLIHFDKHTHTHHRCYFYLFFSSFFPIIFVVLVFYYTAQVTFTSPPCLKLHAAVWQRAERCEAERNRTFTFDNTHGDSKTKADFSEWAHSVCASAAYMCRARKLTIVSSLYRPQSENCQTQL